MRTQFLISYCWTLLGWVIMMLCGRKYGELVPLRQWWWWRVCACLRFGLLENGVFNLLSRDSDRILNQWQSHTIIGISVFVVGKVVPLCFVVPLEGETSVLSPFCWNFDLISLLFILCWIFCMFLFWGLICCFPQGLIFFCILPM